MNPSNGGTRTSSSTPATPSSLSLRPRAARLISGLDEGDEVTFNPSTAPNIRIASPLPSPFASREPSPIPNRHLPRVGPSRSPRHLQASSLGRADGASLKQRTGSTRQQSPASLSGFFSDSWTALQGAATDLLSGTTPPSKAQPKRRKPSYGQTRPASLPPQWGPTGPSSSGNSLGIQVGGGSREEREAAVRAQKRKEMLAAGINEYADSLGRIKRRTSDDVFDSISAAPGDNENSDALVYIHHVQPNDTLAGITIRYSCSAAALRKANRMWPNDMIQARKTVMLPVDSCAVKGRPVTAEEAHLLTTTPDMAHREDPFLTSAAAPEVQPPLQPGHDSISSTSDRPASTTKSSLETEPQWIHDSWVLLPNTTKPTEIARLSRLALAFFPPARRKSQSYSDLDTPSTSLDISRSSLHLPAISPSSHDSLQRPRRGRRLSNATNGYFPSYLAGPGGVGTMGKNVKCPGPGQDSLNKIFASHLPNVAPPPNQQNLYLPDIPLYSEDDDASAPFASRTRSPSGINMENVGGTIEGWVRKLAAKAGTGHHPAERKSAARASVGVPGKGVGGVGDLIEMADQFEIGGDEDEDEERGRQGSLVVVGGAVGSSVSYGHDGLRARGRSGPGAGAGAGAYKRDKDD